jgi:hypothetical protein
LSAKKATSDADIKAEQIKKITKRIIYQGSVDASSKTFNRIKLCSGGSTSVMGQIYNFSA